MTESEALQKSSVVVAALFPEWWKTGLRQCKFCSLEVEKHSASTWHRFEDTPPPNLLQPDNFLRALKGYPHSQVWRRLDTKWGASLINPAGKTYSANADTPEEALLLALYDFVTREKL